MMSGRQVSPPVHAPGRARRLTPNEFAGIEVHPTAGAIVGDEAERIGCHRMRAYCELDRGNGCDDAFRAQAIADDHNRRIKTLELAAEPTRAGSCIGCCRWGGPRMRSVSTRLGRVSGVREDRIRAAHSGCGQGPRS